jgi:polysaccharide biosynthesis/export protein
MNTEIPLESMNSTADTSSRSHNDPALTILRNSSRIDTVVEASSRAGSEITSKDATRWRLSDMFQLLRESQGGVKLGFTTSSCPGDPSRKACGPFLSLFVSLAALIFVGCATQTVPSLPASAAGLQKSVPDDPLSPATTAAIHQFDDGSRDRYTLGAGDQVNVTVWARPELSGSHVVGPDGSIQVPFLGSVHVADMTTDQASVKLSSALSEYYLGAYATITMLSYGSNTVTVLGHVANPGMLTFNDDPTLLEVLAKAGPRPATDGKGTEIRRCAVFRGKDRVLWIDLRPLYRGEDLALNLKMRRGDYVYVPDAADQLVYVMGQVNKPGAYQLTPNMSFLDALAQAGGPGDAAQPGKIVFARPRENLQQVIDLKSFLAGNGDGNYALKEGDIIYVPKSGLAKVGYVLQQINPITSSLLVGAAIF